MTSDLRDIRPDFDKGAALVSLHGCVGRIEPHRYSDDGTPARFL